jgi:hypothetical protein
MFKKELKGFFTRENIDKMLDKVDDDENKKVD